MARRRVWTGRVRVTFCVTTTVSRYAQGVERDRLAGPILTGEVRVGPSPWRGFCPQLLGGLQKVMDGYVLAIEADGSKPAYLRRQMRDVILELADSARAAVVVGGVSALANFRS
jgi:hypothetical protein